MCTSSRRRNQQPRASATTVVPRSRRACGCTPGSHAAIFPVSFGVLRDAYIQAGQGRPGPRRLTAPVVKPAGDDVEPRPVARPGLRSEVGALMGEKGVDPVTSQDDASLEWEPLRLGGCRDQSDSRRAVGDPRVGDRLRRYPQRVADCLAGELDDLFAGALRGGALAVPIVSCRALGRNQTTLGRGCLALSWSRAPLGCERPGRLPRWHQG